MLLIFFVSLSNLILVSFLKYPITPAIKFARRDWDNYTLKTKTFLNNYGPRTDMLKYLIFKMHFKVTRKRTSLKHSGANHKISE